MTKSLLIDHPLPTDARPTGLFNSTVDFSGQRTSPEPEGRSSEESYNYDAVVWKSHELRVIACRNRIQWIVQRAGGSRDGKTRWRSKWFAATRTGLLRYYVQRLERSAPAEAPAFRAWADQQPEHFPRHDY